MKTISTMLLGIFTLIGIAISLGGVSLPIILTYKYSSPWFLLLYILPVSYGIGSLVEDAT